jgi:hypothetical protein
MTSSLLNYKRIARDSVRLYFAPLVGAYKGICREYRRLDAHARRERMLEARAQRVAGPLP